MTDVRIVDGTEYVRFGAGPVWVRVTDHSGFGEIDPRTLLASLQKGAHEIADDGK